MKTGRFTIVTVLVGFVGSCIGIFSFLTGITSLRQFRDKVSVRLERMVEVEAKRRTETQEAKTFNPKGSARTLYSGNRWVVGGKTVTDQEMGLMWMLDDFLAIEGRLPKNWAEASMWVNTINKESYAGYSDWKLPSIAEYRTIREESIAKAFPRSGSDIYWSRNRPSQHVASYIYMNGGAATSGNPEKSWINVRLVRQTRGGA